MIVPQFFLDYSHIWSFFKETNKNYTYNITRFLKWLKTNSLNISNLNVRRYFLYLHDKKYDVNTIRLVKASLNFLFRNVINLNIQRLLGHSKLETTLIYTYVPKIN